MAPSQLEWDALTPEEREAVYKALPGEVTDAEIAMPEGDRHFKAKTSPVGALRGFFARQGRKIYVANELPIYYPAEPRFAPDLLVVLDVDDHERSKWVVSAERKGLDWVLEVHVGGDRKKDAERNVERYARVGIPEYFMFDAERGQLFAYRLASPGARSYSPIVADRGKYESRVLGLDVQVEGNRLRFLAGSAVLLETDELVVRLEGLLLETMLRAEEEARRAAEHAQRATLEARRAEEEARRAEEEARRADRAEAELERLRAEMERLRAASSRTNGRS
ncbi:MAG: Uma2 family endonuclease [Kofleriaceae bacterium]|nr:Uma2 family endonuclease [Kofleriaceae bacterium]